MSADEARAFDAECERSPELRCEYESLAEIVELVAEAGRTELDEVRRVDTPWSSIGRAPLAADVATRLRRIAVAAVLVLAVGAAVWWAIEEVSPIRDSSVRDLAVANTGDSAHRDTEVAGSSADASSTDRAATGPASTEPAAAHSGSTDFERDVGASLWIARAAERPRAGEASDSARVDAVGDIADPAAPQADPLVVALPSEHDDIHIFWVYETGRGADLGSERGKETGT